jgi:hypothetical protein
VTALAIIGAFLLGALVIAVIVLTIHDQQTIATLKRLHSRTKALENPKI